MLAWFPWFLECYPGVPCYLVGVPGNLSLVEVVRVVEVASVAGVVEMVRVVWWLRWLG